MMIIEKEILDFLIAQDLDGIGENVYCERPLEPPDEYILIERTSGSKTNKIEQAMIAIQSISTESMYRAMVIDSLVVDAMELMAEYDDSIFGCHLNSHYNFTNTQTKEYRYQAVFLIYF